MVLLSFDTEEFDLPRERGREIDLETSMRVSCYGTNAILDILKANGVKATFFVTGIFAENAPEVVRRIVAEGHEVGCHGVDHFNPKVGDVAESKRIVEKISGVRTYGYRQPRMFPVSLGDIRASGFIYNSSLNPAFIPGRYVHLSTPRTCFIEENVLQIPASVTPFIRFPLFWLSNHVLPMSIYYAMIEWTLKHDGYFTTYMHPWEFFPLNEHPEWNIQSIIRMNSGEKLQKRLDVLIKKIKNRGECFCTYQSFVHSRYPNLID